MITAFNNFIIDVDEVERATISRGLLSTIVVLYLKTGVPMLVDYESSHAAESDWGRLQDKLVAAAIQTCCCKNVPNT